MATEYSATKEGSAYGVEYYEIQCRVYQSMISDLQSEIDKLKRKKGWYNTNTTEVAKMVTALVWKTWDVGPSPTFGTCFTKQRFPIYRDYVARVAQLVERLLAKEKVAGKFIRRRWKPRLSLLSPWMYDPFPVFLHQHHYRRKS